MKKRTVAVVMAAAMTIGMMVTGVSVQAGVFVSLGVHNVSF